MKTGILAISAIACAVWLAVATEPVTVVAHHADLKPVSIKADTARAEKAVKGSLEPVTAILDDYMNYLAADFENAAGRTIDGRRSNADEGTRTDDGGADDAGQSDVLLAPDCEVSEEAERDSGTDYQSDVIYLGEYTITFYDLCPECTGPWYGMNTTASGRDPIPWYTVAAGPSLPFGTRLFIEDFGEFEVMDRGVSDGSLDILVNNHSEIPSYGVTTKSVYIIGD